MPDIVDGSRGAQAPSLGKEPGAPKGLREMRVVGTLALTPKMRRVTLIGDDMARFATGGLHARLLIPPRGRKPVWPQAGVAGLPVWPGGADWLAQRTYTIRRIDPDAGLIDIDIALHDGPGAGTQFALSARPGDPVGLLGPGGPFPAVAAFTLLVGDETALPAIGRIIEGMAPTACGVALIEVADAAEIQPIDTPSGIDIRWLLRNGAPAGRSGLIEAALAAVPWPEHGDVFAFGGAEFRDFKTLRRHFRREWRLGRDRHAAAAFWRLGPEEPGPAR